MLVTVKSFRFLWLAQRSRPAHEGAKLWLEGVMVTILQWYAVRTRFRHEKRVSAQIDHQDIEVFLPLICRRSRWKDRTVQVQFPLFHGYCFVRFAWQDRVRVCMIKKNGPTAQWLHLQPSPVFTIRRRDQIRSPSSLHRFRSTPRPACDSRDSGVADAQCNNRNNLHTRLSTPASSRRRADRGPRT